MAKKPIDPSGAVKKSHPKQVSKPGSGKSL